MTNIILLKIKYTKLYLITNLFKLKPFILNFIEIIK